MGVAFIVIGANFAPAGLGKVTQTGNVPVEGISITGESSVAGGAGAATYVASFSPSNTTQRGVVWSIVSGNTAASISASTGVLSILPGASLANVTIRATSTGNPSVTADKSIVVTYSGGGFTPIEELTACINFQSKNGHVDTDIVILSTDKVRCKFACGDSGTIFGSRLSSSSDDNGTNLAVDSYGLGYRGLKAKFFGTLRVPANQVAFGTVYYVEIDANTYDVTPSLGSISSSDLTYSESIPISIGSLKFANGTFGESFIGDVYGLEILGENGAVKHRLIPQSDLTFLDEITQIAYPCVGTVVYRENS